MNKIFDHIKSLLNPSASSLGGVDESVSKKLMSLGVLLRVVAEADDAFLPEEADAIKKILLQYNNFSEDEYDLLSKTIDVMVDQRIDVYAFVNDIRDDMLLEEKIVLVENLFRVACSDGMLSVSEHESIRQISQLLRIDHKNFIDAKVRMKKEYGLQTTDL